MESLDSFLTTTTTTTTKNGQKRPKSQPKYIEMACGLQKFKTRLRTLPRQDVNQVPGFVASDLISTLVQDLVNLNSIFTSPYPYPIMFQTCYDVLTLPLDILIHDANNSTQETQIPASHRSSFSLSHITLTIYVYHLMYRTHFCI
jgi:hypothetical protein